MKFSIPQDKKNCSGIYIIRAQGSKKVYVGSAQNLRRRYLAHLGTLRKGIHHSAHLQAFVKKNGLDTLRFECLEFCVPDVLIEREQYFIELLGCTDAHSHFNSCPVAGSARGRKTTEETRRKLSESMKGRVMPEENRLLLVKINTGRVVSEETKGKIRAKLKGRKVPQEILERIALTKTLPAYKEKMKAAKCGKRQSDEHRQKISAGNLGKPKSPEHRARISEARKRYWAEKKKEQDNEST